MKTEIINTKKLYINSYYGFNVVFLAVTLRNRQELKPFLLIKAEVLKLNSEKV